MKLENNIGWCDATTNAVTGCDKVSDGCRFCYAEAGIAARVLRGKGVETWGAKGERVPVNFEPVFRRLNKLCVCGKCHTSAGFEFVGSPCIYQPNHAKGDNLTCGGEFRRIRLFADSNSDWLDPKWPVETLARFLDAIRLAPNVDVLLLTKRIENFQERLFASKKDAAELRWGSGLVSWITRWLDGQPPSNVWIGVSVENQECADERIPQLLKTPAAVRFLSVEPLLESVNLGRATPCGYYCDPEGPVGHVDHQFWSRIKGGIDWVIVGGESGKNRRDCGVEAIESVWRQCKAAGVPCYVKQDSALLPGQRGRLSNEAWACKEFPR